MADLPSWALTRPWRLSELPHVSRAEAAGPRWVAPYPGVRMAADLDPGSPRVRALAAAAAVDGVPLGGWAAAHLLGACDVDGWTLDGALLPVRCCPGAAGRTRRRAGIEPLRSPLAADDVVSVRGTCVTTPVRTAFDLTRTAASLHQAVADLDALLRAGLTSARHLASYADERPGWLGVEQARRAAALADRGSRSRPESWLRVVWRCDAALPPPLVNAPVRRSDGSLLGIPDLLDLGTGLVGEYDGSHHRSARQQHADAVRGECLAGAGLTVVRASAMDLRDPRPLVRRLQAGQLRAREVGRRDWYVAPSDR